MVGSYEYSNIGLGSIRGGGFLDNLQDYQPWRIILLNCVIIIDQKFVEYYFVFNFTVLLFIQFMSSTIKAISRVTCMTCIQQIPTSNLTEDRLLCVSVLSS